MAAPAWLAAIASCAISSGVMGRYGDMLGVCTDPVIAHVMIALWDRITLVSPYRVRCGSGHTRYPRSRSAKSEKLRRELGQPNGHHGWQTVDHVAIVHRQSVRYEATLQKAHRTGTVQARLE